MTEFARKFLAFNKIYSIEKKFNFLSINALWHLHCHDNVV